MTVSGIESGDFINFPLADAGVTVSHTPVTKTVNYIGDETLTDGSPGNKTVIILRRRDGHNQLFEGLRKDADGYIMFDPTVTINRDDKITYGGETFRVRNMIKRDTPVGIDLFKIGELYLIT